MFQELLLDFWQKIAAGKKSSVPTSKTIELLKAEGEVHIALQKCLAGLLSSGGMTALMCDLVLETISAEEPIPLSLLDAGGRDQKRCAALSALAKAGILTPRKVGRCVFYAKTHEAEACAKSLGAIAAATKDAHEHRIADYLQKGLMPKPRP